MATYIEWMRTCSRITVTGHPAISVPAGFTLRVSRSDCRSSGAPATTGASSSSRTPSSATNHWRRRPPSLAEVTASIWGDTRRARLSPACTTLGNTRFVRDSLMHKRGFRSRRYRGNSPSSAPGKRTRRRVRFYVPPPPLPRHAYPARSVEATTLWSVSSSRRWSPSSSSAPGSLSPAIRKSAATVCTSPTCSSAASAC